jgi:gas vesicle protein/predicted flap endonuclease-1-like 5' DNA nuclease
MGSFFRGLLIGIGLSFLFAPMPGQQTRRLVSERLQQLSRSFPGNGQLQQASQQAVDQVAQTAKTVKDNVAQAMPATQPTAQQPTSTVQQTGSQAKPGATSSNEPLGIMEDMPTEMRARLEAQGIQNTSQLLEHTQTKEERSELAYQTSVNDRDLREYVYRADLMRLSGVGEDTAMLLEEAGVNGCKDLRQRNPQHLYNKLAELQGNAHIASTTPTQDQIAQWIRQAKQLTNS